MLKVLNTYKSTNQLNTIVLGVTFNYSLNQNKATHALFIVLFSSFYDDLPISASSCSTCIGVVISIGVSPSSLGSSVVSIWRSPSSAGASATKAIYIVTTRVSFHWMKKKPIKLTVHSSKMTLST